MRFSRTLSFIFVFLPITERVFFYFFNFFLNRLQEKGGKVEEGYEGKLAWYLYFYAGFFITEHKLILSTPLLLTQGTQRL